MKNNQYRINDNVLLKMDFGLSERENFYKQTNSNPNIIQYVSNVFSNPGTEENIDKTVWKFNSKLNKVFNSTGLFEYSDLTNEPNLKIIKGSILLRQGFSWENVFGLLVVIKTTGNQYTQKVLLSQIFDINDFVLDSDESKELINGSFWTKNINFIIPNLEENLMIFVETIMFSDVESSGINIGKINNYPQNDSVFEPLIGEEPIPDYIQTECVILNNHYLKITPKTLELNKTIEQSILDYFSLTNNIAAITVEHVIKYGNDNFGYKTIRISNEDYKFGFVKIGLDFDEFESTEIYIFVSTEIVCNNKLMKREQSSLFDFSDILNPIISNLVLAPESVYPVIFNKVNNINNTIIESKTETKIIPVFQSVFVEIVKSDFKYENKNITFDDINISSYMLVQTQVPQFILSKFDNNGKPYFDLGTIVVESECKFEIIDSTTKKLLKNGLILVK